MQATVINPDSEVDLSLAAESCPAPASNRQTQMLLAGACVAVAFTLCFFLLFWNRFAGLRSGVGSYGAGVLWLKGELPYRDYFSAATPLDSLKAAAVLRIFGDLPIAVRAFGVVERLFLVSVLYFWLARLFSVRHAAIAAMVAMVASAADIADPIASYNHHAIFWAVTAGFCASIALDAQSNRRLALFSLLSGVAAALSFCTKQTIGAGTIAAIPVVCALFLFRVRGWRITALFLASFIGGLLIPLGALFAWLASIGCVGKFIEQVFVAGPAAKGLQGHPLIIRFAMVARAYLLGVILAVIGIVISIRTMKRSAACDQTAPTTVKQLSWTLLTAIGPMIAAIAAVRFGFYPDLSLQKAAIYFAYAFAALIGGYCAVVLLRRKPSRREWQYCLFAAISFVVAATLSLSWPAFEAMTMPGIAFLTAALLHGGRRDGRGTVYVLSVFLIFTVTCAKLIAPFGFADWVEPPVEQATAHSTLPKLSGFLLPPDMVRFVDGTARIVREHSTPADRIYVYPGMGFLFHLFDRRPATSLWEQNIDVVNDVKAAEDADALLKARPAVVIYYREGDDYLEMEDQIWRGGRRSGQHQIIAAIEHVVQQYKLAASFNAGGHTVMVYVRQ